MNLTKKGATQIVLLIWIGASVLTWVGYIFADLHATQLGYTGSIMPNGYVDENWYNFGRTQLPLMFIQIFGGYGILRFIMSIDSERDYQPEPTKEELEQIIDILTTASFADEKKEEKQ